MKREKTEEEIAIEKQLKGCICFWEAKLLTRYLLDLSTVVLIELTVKYLKELLELKCQQ